MPSRQAFATLASASAFICATACSLWSVHVPAFFPEEGWLLKNVDRIRHIPCWIAQGRFDVVTPMTSAWALHRAWPEAKLDLIGDAGHASSEPGIIDSLVRGTDWAASV